MTTTIDVNSEAQLNQAIGTLNAAGGGAYVVQFTSSITESVPLTAIRFAAGVTGTIDGGGFTLDGASEYQGLFVYSGDLTAQDLTIADMRALGGNGGGGGAGLGGGLFVAGSNGTLATGGTVTLETVGFVSDAAAGGAGEASGAGGALSGAVGGIGQGGTTGGSLGGGGEFGGGGGAGQTYGGGGGFGGGGGGGSSIGGGGGFGAGAGSEITGFETPYGGGGGLGAGGDVFIQQGGSLTIEGGSLAAGTVTGGTAGSNAAPGSAFGSSMFLQGNQTVTLAPVSGQTLTIAGVIADQTGSGGTGGNAGAGGIATTGAGRIVFAAVDTYTGTTNLGGGGTLELASGASATASTLAFTGAGTLQLDALTSKVKNVTGFTGADDALDFAGVAPGSLTLAQGAANTATIDGMVVSGTFGTLSKGSDGGGGTVITAACFRQGTRIATERGEIVVEALRTGDRAVTACGALRPIVWIGYRSVGLANHPRPQDVMPVRVRADAFAPGRPARDLWLSPDHAVLADGVLIPIRYLLNGASVAQQAASRVTWWHVELDAHDAIVADGLATESYLDTGNRAAFANGGSTIQADPDFSRAAWNSGAFAPLVVGGAVVRAVRARLLDRLAALGYTTTDEPDLRAFAAGRRLPAQVGGDWRRFVVPDGATTVHLRSRTARPAELHPDSDDWSEVGCAVTALRFNGRDTGLDDPRLTDGWRAPDETLRWTRGHARLAVVPRDVVELRLWHGLRYHLAAADDATSRHGSIELDMRAVAG